MEQFYCLDPVFKRKLGLVSAAYQCRILQAESAVLVLMNPIVLQCQSNNLNPKVHVEHFRLAYERGLEIILCISLETKSLNDSVTVPKLRASKVFCHYRPCFIFIFS